MQAINIFHKLVRKGLIQQVKNKSNQIILNHSLNHQIISHSRIKIKLSLSINNLEVNDKLVIKVAMFYQK